MVKWGAQNGEAMLKNGATTQDPRLDRIVQYDERSREFDVRGTTPLVTPRSYTWRPGLVLDQGREGACVGFGVSAELSARPVPISDVTDNTARSLYWNAQQIDPWPGGAYPGADPVYEGTSVLAGVKAAQQAGFYGEYRWAFSEPDLALAVGWHGPAIIGVNMRESMMEPTTDGFMVVGGQVVGGHCMCVYGVRVVGASYYLVRNSWGPNWGMGGSAYISRADMKRLLDDDGEACIPIVRKRPQLT